MTMMPRRFKFTAAALVLLAHMLCVATAGTENLVVPSNNDRGDNDNPSPPSGPLPDGPLDDASTCSDFSDDETCRGESPAPATSGAVPTGKYYCLGAKKINNAYDRYSTKDCFFDNPSPGDFVTPALEPGEITPILWRSTGKIVSQYAFQMGVPTKLISTLLNYCNELGITDLMQTFTSTDPIEAEVGTHTGQFISMKLPDGNYDNNNLWYAQRPATKWQSNMHWISPANENTHEAYLRVLAEGGFDEVLDAIGNALGLDGLVAYHLTFIGVSHTERGFRHHDSTGTNGGVYNVIIPLLLEDDVPPELVLWDDDDKDSELGQDAKLRGGYKYRLGNAVLMGDDAMHGTYECDYRNLTNAQHGGYIDEDDEEGGTTKKRVGMRLAATVYVAEVYPENVKAVAQETLTQIFPFRDESWLLSQEGRHWQSNTSDYAMDTWMLNDMGRKAFRSDDELDDCDERVDDGMCESDVEGTRKKCPFSCDVYIEEGPTKVVRVHSDDDDTKRLVNVCTQNRTGIEECKLYEDDTAISGDFITPNLQPGEMFPIVWRENLSESHHTIQAAPYAFQVGVPPELTEALLKYCNDLGITEAMRELTGDNPLPISPNDKPSHAFYELRDGNEWYVQRPAKKWRSNMHWISPADEKTHEEYLQILAQGNFDLVLDAIGNYLGLVGLAAYHLTFIGVSYSEKGFMHRDTHHTGGSVYNVIIPLILEDDSTPELAMMSDDELEYDSDDPEYDDDTKGYRMGSLKYKVGTAAMMGDDAMHGTQACDYRSTKGMRLAATVYIADINKRNAPRIARQTLTQIFPLPNPNWLVAQSGRHWRGDDAHGISIDDDSEEKRRSMVNDVGRGQFKFRDKLSDCAERAKKDMCVSDVVHTRTRCLKSCHIYEEDSNEEQEGEKVSSEFNFVFEEFTPGKQIDAFFASLDEDDACIDESEICQELAQAGECMTDPDKMEELGCDKSCLHCLTPGSRELFSLGVDQVMEEVDDDDSSDDDSEDEDEEEPPSPSDVAKVMAKTEHYFVHEIWSHEDLNPYRLSCQNFDKHCAIWAAQGSCEKTPGFMGKTCPAACLNCPMVDRKIRCPIDEETNAFKPGDINSMFERWLEEAGQDITSFSKENLPVGGKHQFGEIKVVTSPYHDMEQYIKEEERDDDPETFSPIPWVVSIDGFLSDKECERLIELGEGKGYRRSTEYSDTRNVDGSSDFVESKGRTSLNTFCQEGCDDDPVVKRVIERMTQMTAVPYDNYESLQLVRYSEGQFYQYHHDFAAVHDQYQYGPRILTFFLYLNDVESGGGTKFDDLNFTAEPKKGMALVWPSMTNDLKEMDDWTWHEALPVEKGIKYGANAWIHLRDYQNVPGWCM